MPWRFVEMYGRTQFSDIVVFQALEENNRALRLLGRGESKLPAPAVQGLAMGVFRLAASWQLLRAAVPAEMAGAAERRLSVLEQMLTPELADESARATVQRLLQRAEDERQRDALEVLGKCIGAALRRRHQPLSMTRLSLGFQAESSAWQALPLPGTDEQCVREGLERCYRRGQEISLGRLEGSGDEPLAEWRRWARHTFYQLDSMRASLSPDNRAQRWCLGRLIDSLCKHDGLIGVRECLPDVALDARQQMRVEAALEACLDEFRTRALKLVTHAYARTPEEFVESIWADATRHALEFNQPQPRRA